MNLRAGWALPLLALLVAAGGAMPAQGAVAATGPRQGASFDCRKAGSRVEKAICADAGLAALDRRIGTRFGALVRQMDATTATALRQDQRWFIAIRDRTLGDGSRAPTAEQLDDLKSRLRYRAIFLDRVALRSAPGMAGIWGNLAGEVRIAGGGQGAKVTFSGAEPDQGRWVCEAHGPYRGTATSGIVADPEIDDGVIALNRAGSRLEVEEKSRDGRPRSSPYCGLNGSLSGSYFRLNS